MSFVYPRVVSVHRPGAQAGEGGLPYGGASQPTETLVAEGIPASIQERREGQKNVAGLPGDGSRPTYYVFIPKRALARGAILNLDIITDDLGLRYQVTAPYWDSLGHRPTAELMKP